MKKINPAPAKIAVVIPCHNEAKTITKVITKLPIAELREHGLELQVFVINNVSTDNTADIARQASAVVINEPKKGKGNAMVTGFKSLPADIDFVVMLDGDDTYSSPEILRMLEPLQSDFCDVVVGSRLAGRIQSSAMNTLNRWGNQIFTAGVRVLYRANITDVLTGYFAWKKPVVDAIAPHLTSQGFAIEMEMITKMARLSYSMASVPISYHPRVGASNLRPFRDGFRILLMLLKNLNWKPAERPLVTTGAFTPRKIVFVSDAIYPYMKGGKEKRLFEITTRLAAMGHDVHIYTMHWWASPRKTQLENGVKLHALCKFYPLYKGDRRTLKEGIMFGLACLKLLHIKFDVLDVDQMPFFPIFSTWLICLIRGKKLHATWHEAMSRKEWIGYMGSGGVVASLIEAFSTRLPHRITAASNHTRQLLASIHGRVKGVNTVASGIDTALLNQVPSAPINCDVLFAGRLVKDKNVAVLIDAIGLIAQKKPSIQCVIIGQGPEEKRLKAEVEHKNLQNNIMFLRPLANAADLYAHMKSAKVFCSPSAREGFGITALEALGCGTPVITTNCPNNAARHFIEHDKNGSIVAVDPAQIAQAIEHWVNAAQKPAISLDVADYDWHNLAKRQAEVYTL